MRILQLLHDQGGSALVITLLIVTTLVGLTIAFSEDTGVELTLAAFSRDAYRAHLAAVGACDVAMAVINSDQNKDMDSLREPWAEFGLEEFAKDLLKDATLSGRIVDENSKFNINELKRKEGESDEAYEARLAKQAAQLERLFVLLGIEVNLVNPILDWLDEDDEKRLEGAENYYYQGLPQPYECGNGPFLTLRQVLLVKGVSESFAGEGLLNFLTIYGDGKININTASREVLQCLDEEMSPSAAEAILVYRAEQDFNKLEDLTENRLIDVDVFNRIKDRITIKSSAFTLEMEGQFQGAKTRINAVVERKEGKLQLVYWQVV